jgi:hypothetical protein
MKCKFNFIGRDELLAVGDLVDYTFDMAWIDDEFEYDMVSDDNKNMVYNVYINGKMHNYKGDDFHIYFRHISGSIADTAPPTPSDSDFDPADNPRGGSAQPGFTVTRPSKDKQSHHKQGGVQTSVIQDTVLDLLDGKIPAKQLAMIWNILKYTRRIGHKGQDADDMYKIADYCHKLVNDNVFLNEVEK